MNEREGWKADETKSRRPRIRTSFCPHRSNALFLRERPHGPDQADKAEGGEGATHTAPQVPADPSPPGGNPSFREDGVLVYYFHGAVRCPTCRAIEALSRHAIQAGFARALEEGTLEWHVVNVEEEGNDHFIKEYQLFTSSLVIQKMNGGKKVEWKNLERVWDLIRDESAFTAYVQCEIRSLTGPR